MKFSVRRKAFWTSIVLLIGAFCGRLLTVNVLACVLTPLALLACGVLLYFLKKKALLLALAIAMALGVAASVTDYFTRYDGDVTGERTVQGRLCEKRSYGYLLEDIVIEGESYHGKLLVIGSTDGKEIGKIVTMTAQVETLSRDPFDAYDSSFYNDRIYYRTRTFETIRVEEGKKALHESIRERIDEGMRIYVSEENAGLLKSLLFGDKAELSPEDKETMNGIGLAHVFAVSGLHVGFLTAIVLFLLRKGKVNGVVSTVVVVALLSLYGLLTGFPTGLKRVSVALAVSYAGRALTRKADPPTTLGVAAALIVLTNPRELFDVGFLMSFVSVLGIICYYRPIYECLKKAGTNRIFTYAFGLIATTVSACLFILPISLEIFGSFSPYAILSNLFIVPMVSVAFPFAAIAAFFGSVWSGFGTLFLPAAYIVEGIRLVAGAFSRLPYSSLAVSGMGVFAILYYATLLLCSRFFRIPKASKYTLIFGTSASFVVLAVLAIV